MSQITPIIYLILSLLQFIILLRFICQIMNVNYYNPVTQSIVKISGYILAPFNVLNLNSNTYFLFIILYIFTLGKLYLPMLDSSELLGKSDSQHLLKSIASKGGTTEAALSQLKKDKVDLSIRRAVQQAYKKSKKILSK